MSAPIPTRVETATIDGVSLAVTRIGRGQPIVCLAATGHDASDFAPLAQRIGAQYELICIDWPSHGNSGRDTQPASAERYAELIEGALWQLSIQDPIVLGNSIGGAVAIHYASRRSVRALVLCDSAGLVEVSSKLIKLCGLFEKFFAAGERGAWWFKSAFALYYRIVLKKPAAAAQRQHIVAQSKKLAPVIRQAWASFSKPSADIRHLAASLDVPIWVAWARNDRVIPLSYCLPAIQSLKHATLDTFDAGHSAFIEQPDEFAQKLSAYMNTLPQSDANNTRRFDSAA